MTERVVRRWVPVSSLWLALALLAGACAGSPADGRQLAPSDDTPIEVVTDFSILGDFIDAVGGSRVNIAVLVPLGGDPHAYEPRPADARAIADADLVIEHGLGLSPWMSPLIANANGSVAVVGDAVAEHAVRDHRGEVDPHLWMSPRFAQDYVEEIRRSLASVDPDGADDYGRNAHRFVQELRDLDLELQTVAASIRPERRLLITPHDAYGYFADHFGLEVLGTLVGITSEEEPSAQRMREIVDLVAAHEVPAVFVESTVATNLIEQVAKDAGAEVAGPLYGDSVGAPGSGAESYVGMMRANLQTIADALAGDED